MLTVYLDHFSGMSNDLAEIELSECGVEFVIPTHWKSHTIKKHPLVSLIKMFLLTAIKMNVIIRIQHLSCLFLLKLVYQYRNDLCFESKAIQRCRSFGIPSKTDDASVAGPNV